MAVSNITNFISTSDVSSLNILFGVIGGYISETHLIFDKDGFSVKCSTDDNYAMIVFKVSESQLLNYYFESERDEDYIGVNLKSTSSMMKSIPAKSTGQIYRINGDDDLYINSEGSSSKDGASKIPTINLPICIIEPPLIEPNDNYVKINTSDFCTICSQLAKLNCKRIVFTLRKNVLGIKGFNEYNECRNSTIYRNTNPNDVEGEDNEIIDDSTFPTSKRGKVNVVVKRKIPSDQYSAETTIDKLKPLNKINNLCKNGIVYVYVCNRSSDMVKRENIIILKVNVGQIGVLEIYLRDTKE